MRAHFTHDGKSEWATIDHGMFPVRGSRHKKPNTIFIFSSQHGKKQILIAVKTFSKTEGLVFFQVRKLILYQGL